MDEGRLVTEVVDESPIGRVVEERGELVILFLQDGIVLVIVAARAAHREPEPYRRRGLDTIGDVVQAEFLIDDAAFGAGAVIAMEAGRDLLAHGGIWQQVAP